VLNPTDTKDLFFVADGTGGHLFAETLKEHNANVVKWRAIEKKIRAKAEAKTEAKAAGDTPTTAAAPATPKKKTRAVIRKAPPGKGQPAAPAKAEDAKGQQPAVAAESGTEVKAKP
jgi:UPF0755 protein